MTPALEIIQDEWPTYDEAPVRGGELRLIRPGGARNDFNPASFRQDFQIAVSYLDPLLRVDPRTMEPRPWLAERWAWSDDGQTLTYHLRSDIVWHDGSPLSAEDVAFALTVYRDDLDSGVRNLFTSMDATEVVDERTVVVRLVEPDGGWLFNASTQLIFQREQYLDFWQANPPGERSLAGFDWRAEPPVGTGPWRVEDWGAEGVAFRRNEDYWRKPPYFARMTVAWEDDEEQRLTAFKDDDADIVWPIAPGDVERLDGIEGRLYATPSPVVMFAAFNFDNPLRGVPGIFANVWVRRALSLAIDRARYAREVFDGFVDARAAGTIMQPWARADELAAPGRDYEQATRLLSEAGWVDVDGDGIRENAVGIPFSVTVIVRNDEPDALLEVLRAAKRDLVDVGVQLQIEQLSPEQFRERWIVERDYDLIAYSYRLFPGFTDFDLYGSPWDIRFNPQGWNPGGYQNEEVDAAIRQSLVETDVDAQREALVRLQAAADEDLFALWLGVPSDLVLVAEDVLGYQPNLLWPLADTWKLWRAEPS